MRLSVAAVPFLAECFQAAGAFKMLLLFRRASPNHVILIQVTAGQLPFKVGQ